MKDQQRGFLLKRKSLLRWLAIRPRSTAETRTYLHEHRNNLESKIEETIRALTEQKLLDDDAFARWLVESRLRRSPRGARLLYAELHKKGIAKEIIDSVLARLRPEEEIVHAQEALATYMHRYTRLPALTAKRRYIQYLRRRGFSLTTVFRVIDTTYEESVEYSP